MTLWITYSYSVYANKKGTPEKETKLWLTFGEYEAHENRDALKNRWSVCSPQRLASCIRVSNSILNANNLDNVTEPSQINYKKHLRSAESQDLAKASPNSTMTKAQMGTKTRTLPRQFRDRLRLAHSMQNASSSKHHFLRKLNSQGNDDAMLLSERLKSCRVYQQGGRRGELSGSLPPCGHAWIMQTVILWNKTP